ncbi:putative zinc transporter msc2 [Elasticomyces elasticus]|nr:putative zinc transporter msc2 [Elasticomyces elasticus]KAK3642705.1 putative zinc transporter msc2 [Elasticomyces elasticus]KAK4910157.1 putative zinc transporter msc2 [Elasticomyces elasticus]KAK5766411.1 putative zinc transporter msc2 [Elasticomyces elasticus]
MASGYALPTSIGGSHFQQPGHNRSHSSNPPYLSPNKAIANPVPSSNGYPTVKKASSHSGLYTHAETSRDSSPLPSPGSELYKTPFETNTFSFENNTGLSAPLLSSHTRVKSMGRTRGESDLGRPADPRSPAYRPTLARLDSAGTVDTASTSWFSLPEALTALLVPLPYLLASAAYSTITHEELSGGTHELPAYARLQHGSGGKGKVLPKQKFSSDSGLVEACTLTSGTLLLIGILAKVRAAERQLDRRKVGGNYQQQVQGLFSLSSARKMTIRAISLALPFFAAMQIGGFRTGLVMLTATAADLFGADVSSRRTFFEWKHVLSARIATLVVLLLGIASDFAGWTFHAPISHMVFGYLALALSVFVLPPPLPSLAVAPGSGSKLTATSSLIASTGDANLTLLSGFLFTLLTVAISVISSTSPSIHGVAITFSTLSIAATTAAVMFSQPHTLRSDYRAGLGGSCLLIAGVAFLYSPSTWPGTICNGGLSALSCLGVMYDSYASNDDQDVHEHAHNTHKHHDHPVTKPDGNYSGLTKFIMSRCEPGSLVYGIISEKDSRRIAYFTVLNFSFMIVQGVYGYLSGSLGLLSDTVHMFFDCFGLIVGLGAAVASKWPTSAEKPHGWGKLNTLAGFGNGVFLMLVSVEFVWEAIEGITEGTELRHVKELLWVSTAGFIVNMVGLVAFGHAHAGHDHGHSHAGHAHEKHDHGHKHSHSHTNGHAHHHESEHNHTHSHDAKPVQAALSHGGHEHNDNMHGIFLHVAADAGGSLAVIVSTALTLWKPWYLWDPLATIIIAILIFAAAVPLVISSGQKLLLVVPDEMEYMVKNTLQELSEMREVVGYAAPRFWIDDREDTATPHDHHDHHDHHEHNHDDSGGGKGKVMGVIHVIASQNADLEDVRMRVEEFVRERNMDLVIHVERETDETCWCGGGPSKTG